MASAVQIDREWLGIRELTKYASVSERTLREWMHREEDALPAVRVDGKILVRKSQFDGWLERHKIQQTKRIDVDAIVNGLLREAG
jgi:excisionase family DNA binding protein